MTSKTGTDGSTTQYVYTQGTSGEADGVFAPGITPVPGLLTQVIESNELTTITTYTGLHLTGSYLLAQRTEVAGTEWEVVRIEFEYYDDGTLRLERRPMGQETTYTYDNFGRLWTVTDAKLQTTTYTYDDQWRLWQIHYADGKTIILSYDEDGNLAGYDDGTTSASYKYDEMGRKLSETVHYGAFTKAFSYTYHDNGQKQTFAAPDNTVYTYTYGFNNELQSVQIPGVGTITISDYAWNRPAAITYPGGTQRTATYDALMRLQSLTVTAPGGNPLLNYAYTYDPTGNILTKNTGHGNYAYSYADASRLTTVDNPTLDDESYTYDDVGNRLTASNATGSITHNPNNELTVYGDDYDAVRMAINKDWEFSYKETYVNAGEKQRARVSRQC